KVAEAGVALAAAEDERLTAEQEVMMAEHWKQSSLTEEQKDYLNHPEKRIEELEAFVPAPTEPPAPTPSPDPDGGEGDEGGDEGGAIDPVTTPEPTGSPAPSDPPADVAALLEKWKTLKEKTDAVIDAKTALGAISTQQLDAAQKKMDEIQAEIDRTADSPAIREAKAARDEAYTSYLDLYNALQQRKAADAKSNAALGLELTDLNTQIEAQKKKIAELSGGEENQIVANVAGTVQSVECTSGDTVAKDQVVCVIEVPDMGYTLSFSVTNDQAARLKVGDSATVSNYYWGSQIVATLQSIRVDPRDPQSSKLLTFEVSGDVNAGTDLTISVGQRSANFDTIVPKSAIHNDSNGDFVFVVEAKSSPLGNRYIARRVSVEILAQDDTNAAVTGDIYWGDYVITTSNAPIKNGDMVRLAD
ncbi:MAG: HlyD family efflux transporter periplasmic adaptor subunit, partial [Oscillospiraceae bacterium]|nr:HlyD family efflux transporter periplasmic adaptor subunit [Oscillospiraceae bacterium]